MVIAAFLSLLTCVAAAAPARAGAISHETVAGLLSPPADPADITYAATSPDGAWIAFNRAETRIGQPGQPWEYSWDCADNWVMRIDGTRLKQLTQTCDYGSNAGLFRQSVASWLPDGSIVADYTGYTDHFGTQTTRWKYRGGAWNTGDTIHGSLRGGTPDQRFVLVEHRDWGYQANSWFALELATDELHPIWVEWHQGDGEWSPACATAPERNHATPDHAVVLATLTGDSPICTFARVAKPAPVTPTTPTADKPTGEQPSAGTPLYTPLPQTTIRSSIPAEARTADTPNVPTTVSITAATTSVRRAAALGAAVKFATPSKGTAKIWLLGGTGPGAGTTVIARRSQRLAAGAGIAQFRLTPAARRALRRSTTLTVRIAFSAETGTRAVSERTFTLTT